MFGTSNLIQSADVRLSGAVKVRNPFKKWKTRWAVLVEGRLILFKVPLLSLSFVLSLSVVFA